LREHQLAAKGILQLAANGILQLAANILIPLRDPLREILTHSLTSMAFGDAAR
jgi:hypothetical protein